MTYHALKPYLILTLHHFTLRLLGKNRIILPFDYWGKVELCITSAFNFWGKVESCIAPSFSYWDEVEIIFFCYLVHTICFSLRYYDHLPFKLYCIPSSRVTSYNTIVLAP